MNLFVEIDFDVFEVEELRLEVQSAVAALANDFELCFEDLAGGDFGGCRASGLEVADEGLLTHLFEQDGDLDFVLLFLERDEAELERLK